MQKLSIAAMLALMAAPTALPTQVHAEAGDFLVRARAIIVAPNESSGEVSGLAGSSVSVDNAIMPELDFTYFVTNNIGVELILATTNHDIAGQGAIEGLGDIADTWVLPPTLTLQYHFLPDERIRPYVGAGINYTIFYSEGSTDSLNTALGDTSVDLDDSFGWALQAGVDVDINDRFFLNFDVKYINMNTTATLNSVVGGDALVTRTVDVDINPIVAGIGIGMRF